MSARMNDAGEIEVTLRIEAPGASPEKKRDREASSEPEPGTEPARKKRNSTPSSKYVGVSELKRGGVGVGFQARMRIDRAVRYFGAFAKAEDAAKAYDAKARELNPTSARLNFPTPEDLERGCRLANKLAKWGV